MAASGYFKAMLNSLEMTQLINDETHIYTTSITWID